jgi:hypothetical protein
MIGSVNHVRATSEFATNEALRYGGPTNGYRGVVMATHIMVGLLFY